MGQINAKLIASTFSNIKSFISFFEGKSDILSTLENTDGLGPKVIQSFIEYSSIKSNKKQILKLTQRLDLFIKKIDTVKSKITGKKIIFTGTLSSMSRAEAKTKAEKLGAKVVSSISKSTAAQSTLYINDTSSCVFEKNKTINKIYGNSLIYKHRVIKKNYTENKNFYSIIASHNGYEKKFGCIHTRSIKISKREDKIFGEDEIKKTKNNSNPLNYSIRFHVYPNNKVVKTMAGNSVLSKTNNFEIEKNIFLGNKNRIINNESISISGKIIEDITLIKWIIQKIN